MTLVTRPAPACALLLVAYLALSFLNDPHGYLGTDTGGKVATLRVMEERGELDPDLGYWAEEWDPAGRLHPFYYTSHLDGRWVNVTTLPALYAAYPLFGIAGYRGALLLPMAGSVLAALAARALARRLGAGERGGWRAFWILGLASPLTIYALDFWEHSLGVAAVAWAVVLLYDVAHGRRRWWFGAAAGLLFGIAATMRTEALVYGAVATAVAAGYLLWRGREVAAPVLVGLTALAGLAVPWVANTALERATIGTGLRAERAAGTVGIATTPGGATRVEEAVMTGVNLDSEASAASYLVGAALLLLLVVFARRAVTKGGDPRLARLALAGAAALHLLRFAGGLGFVPGLIAATPLAAVGLAWAWSDGRTRLVAAVALAALPVVWATQFSGGAAPQWAGRYILASGLLLAVVGVVALDRLHRWAAVAAVTLAAVVTALGLAWLSSRSHDVARSGLALHNRPEPVLVSRIAHLARENGYRAVDRRWLTAVNDDDLAFAAEVVQRAGIERFALIEVDGQGVPPPARVGEFNPGPSDRVTFISGIPLRVTTYTRSG